MLSMWALLGYVSLPSCFIIFMCRVINSGRGKLLLREICARVREGLVCVCGGVVAMIDNV